MAYSSTTESEADRTSPNFYRSTALIVEDDPLVRLVVVDRISEIGVECAEAASAGEAIDYLLGGATPDLIVSDVQMPGALDGKDLVRWAKSWFPSIPTILISAAPGDLSGVPADRFIEKPFDIDFLAEQAEKLLRQASNEMKSQVQPHSQC